MCMLFSTRGISWVTKRALGKKGKGKKEREREEKRESQGKIMKRKGKKGAGKRKERNENQHDESASRESREERFRGANLTFRLCSRAPKLMTHWAPRVCDPPGYALNGGKGHDQKRCS